MGSMHQEDSMNSSSDQEGDQPDQENHEMGTGRSYECVFCKRGFNTAQALGGHMNIHRKDRAKNRPALITSQKNEEIHVGTRFFPQISSLPPRYFSDPEVQVNYRTLIPVSTSDSSPLYATHEYVFCGQNSQITEPLNLPLQFGSFPNGEYHGEEEREIGSKEDQLDLELRLGHYP